MNKLFIDSNVWLRFILEDNEQAEECKKLIKLIEEGRFRVYTSSIVMLEINFVLSSIYKIRMIDVIKDLEAILKTRNITLLEKTDFNKALSWHKQFKIKLADCLIGSQIDKNMILVSFDKDFDKLPVKVKTPGELVD
ncbi:MAG: PIN domain-containing protein [Candidatus Beckwithbacteria bacterium]|nr:PIN domain-containing protein [Patescibacteria group bacterium]